MIALIQAAADLQAVCETHAWQFCFIGGLAVQRWGEPRETVHVDLTLLTGFTDETRYISILTEHFESSVDDTVEFANATACLPFEESVVARSSQFMFSPGVSLRTCSAEALIVLKAFADRPKDWLDIEGVIIRQSAGLDWGYMRDELAPLAELKESPELVDRLDRLRITLEP